MRIRIVISITLLFSFGNPAHAAEDERLKGLAMLALRGRAVEARSCLLEVLDTYEREHDVSHLAMTNFFIAVAEAATNDRIASRAHYDNAVKYFRATHDFFGEWFALRTAADLEKSEGRYEAAIERHEDAINALEQAKASGATVSQENLQTLILMIGVDPFEQLGVRIPPQLLTPMILGFAEGSSYDGFGEILTAVGQFDRAEIQFARAAETSHAFGDMLDASVYAHIGELRRRQGRLDEARASYRRALESAGSMRGLPLHDDWIEVDLMSELADLELLDGHLEEALAWNDRALKSTRDAKNPAREAVVMESRGNLLMRANHFDEAEAAFSIALKLAQDQYDTFREAQILADRGAIYMFRGRYGPAANDLERAISLFQEIKRPELEAPIWILLSEVYILVEADDSAALTIEKARALAKTSGYRVAQKLVELLFIAQEYHAKRQSAADLADAMNAWMKMPEQKGEMSTVLEQVLSSMITGQMPTFDLETSEKAMAPMIPMSGYLVVAKILIERGDTTAAIGLLKKGLEVNPSKEFQAGLRALIGTCYWREGRVDEAVDAFMDVARTMEWTIGDLRTENMLAPYLGGGRQVFYKVLIEGLVKQKRYADAFDFAERGRARAFLQLVGNSRVDATRGADTHLLLEIDTLRARIAALEEEMASSPSDRIRRELTDLRQQFAASMTRVQASNPAYTSLMRIEPASAEVVQAQLPAGATLISYYISGDHIHAWVASRKSLNYVSLPIDSMALKDAECWAAQLTRRGRRGPEPLPCGSNANAEMLFDRLIAPLQDKLTTPKLIIVPNGALHRIPFAALRNRKSGHYLLQDYTLVYAPSASALAFLRGRESAVNGKALVIGDPEPSSPDERRLPGAAREATLIAKKFGTEALLGSQATESALYELGGRIDLLHIAAHGRYDQANPLFSRIALARDSRADGNLNVVEILDRLDLSGVNLVVLSACATALGKDSGADDVIGLTRALLYAGAPGVISALWNIDDEAAVGFMNDFYDHLLAGETAAEALQHAQISMLHGGTKYKSPAYWAAFTLNGDPQGRWH